MLETVPTRLVLCFIAFFGYINLYLMRANFSVISVAMITPFEQQQREINATCNATQTCDELGVTSSENKTTLDWDERTRALVLAVFSYGYCTTQILGGRLAERFGTKYIFFSAITVPAVLNFFIPTAAKFSYWAVVFIRVLQGIFQGVSWPSMNALLAHWMPPNERSRFIGIIAFGSTFGMVFILPLSGFLCDAFSWEYAFYITGVFPLIWGIFWIMYMYEEPRLHPRISNSEKFFIENAISEGGTRTGRKRAVPWKSIVTSLPFLAIIVCDCGNSYCLSMYSIQMPNFLANIFHFSMTKTGILAGLPFLFRYCGSCTFSISSDYLITKKYLSVAATRRVFSAIAMFGPALMMVLIISFALDDMMTFIGLTCSALFLNGSVAASKLVNHLDIAPSYAGTLFGISNTLSSISTFVSVQATGEILQNEPTLERWIIAFWTVVPVQVCCEIFYLVFMSGQLQSWNFHGIDEENSRKLSEIEGQVPDRNISEKEV